MTLARHHIFGSLDVRKQMEQNDCSQCEAVITAQVQNELRVDVVDPRSFDWLQVFDSRHHLVVRVVSRKVEVGAECPA